MEILIGEIIISDIKLYNSLKISENDKSRQKADKYFVKHLVMKIQLHKLFKGFQIG